MLGRRLSANLSRYTATVDSAPVFLDPIQAFQQVRISLLEFLLVIARELHDVFLDALDCLVLFFNEITELDIECVPRFFG